jgi:hypothetical protein
MRSQLRIPRCQRAQLWGFRVDLEGVIAICPTAACLRELSCFVNELHLPALL